MKYSQFVDEIHIRNQLYKSRFIKFSFIVTIVLLIGLGIFEFPHLWEWYSSRLHRETHKVRRFSYQKLIEQCNAVEAELQEKEKRKRKIHTAKKVDSGLIYAVLASSEMYTIFYCKQEKKSARLQGRAKNMEAMHEALKLLEEKSGYCVTVDSFEKKERGEYIFSLTAVSKKA